MSLADRVDGSKSPISRTIPVLSGTVYSTHSFIASRGPEAIVHQA